jgi:hypothetical protein
LATGRYKSGGPFDSNLQACLTIGRSWIIRREKMPSKLGEYLRLIILREEVEEDALQCILRGSNALARRVAIQLKNVESVQKTIINLGKVYCSPFFPAEEKQDFVNTKR